MAVRALGIIALSAVLSACASDGRPSGPVARQFQGAGTAAHYVAGFEIDTPAEAARAAGEGVTTAIEYGEVPAGNALAKALVKNHITVIDGSVSADLYYWECHRTRTVAPPPSGYTNCSRADAHIITSMAALLRAVKALIARDASRSYVVGYWVLDDWPSWDAGSARDVLPKIRELIANATPGYPAICGFGAEIERGHRYGWNPGTAKNYSNAGCDRVAWYNYGPIGEYTQPSDGNRLNWSMTGLLPAMQRSLAKYGWQIARTPLMGIGQAWSGPFDGPYYQPGLSREQMLEQAQAFCAFGATSIAWYSWGDSGFMPSTQTPNNSSAIASGIKAGKNACTKIWRRE
ncbi:MAG TPA: hypothetical protein VK760_07810 [Candidatus Acidoferrales bacterium]|jgi:hypothetical protein|nr:hypothetical protein [Candidatus Acidoferrales bacterium]